MTLEAASEQAKELTNALAAGKEAWRSFFQNRLTGLPGHIQATNPRSKPFVPLACSCWGVDAESESNVPFSGGCPRAGAAATRGSGQPQEPPSGGGLRARSYLAH